MRWRTMVLLVALACLGCESTGGGSSGGGLGGSGYRDAHKLDWTEATSKHFTIYGAMPADQLVKAAERLELFHAVAEFTTGTKFPTPTLPLTIFAFDRDSKVQAFTYERGGGGALRQSMRGNSLLFSMQRMRRSDAYSSIQWLYTRHLLNNHGKYVYPSWYEYGLAQYLRSVKVLKDGRVEVGAVPSAAQFRGSRQQQWLPYMGTRWKTLRQVFTATHGEWISSYQFAAETWAVLHYLNFGPDKLGANRKLARYFRRVEKGEDPAEAVRSTFGFSVEDLDRNVRGHVMKQEYQSAVFEASNFPHDKTATTRPMTSDEVARHLGDLSLDAAGGRELWRPGYGKSKFEQARSYYEAAKSGAPKDVLMARAGVARSLLGLGRVAEASEIADALIAEAPENEEAQLVMGHVIASKAGSAGDPKERARLARKARKHYVKSWKLNDRVPETFAMYGSTYLIEGQDAKKGIETLEHARDLLPSSTPIRYRLALVYLEAGDKVNARRMAKTISITSFSEEMDKRVKEILDATEDVEES